MYQCFIRINGKKSMKYPQLVHMPGDVEHWLEKQFEVCSTECIVCAEYFLNLLAQVNTSPSMECFACSSQSYEKYVRDNCFQAFCDRQSWDFDSSRRLDAVHYPMSALNEKCDIEQLVDELCVKFRETECNGLPLLDVSTDFGNDITKTDAPAIHSDALLREKLIDVKETQPFPSFNSVWTRGLLHDSEPVKDQSKMEDYFSSLFYENPSDNFGFEFTCLKSDELLDGKERDRIIFYNRQNLLASESTERLYERNTDIDKLIAKFDANIEGIWNPTCRSEDIDRYETRTTNSSSVNGSSLIWSFGNEKCDNYGKESNENFKSNSSTWSQFSSPAVNSNAGIFNNVNFPLSKWSSMDGQNDGNVFLNHRKHESSFTEVIPRSKNGSIGILNPVVPRDRMKAKGDEEDLLTSTRTHFRPIRTDDEHSGRTIKYSDGTTFNVSNELEKVNFTRSNSGTLYLYTGSESGTPWKYMEYKEKDETRKLIRAEMDSSLKGGFVPKFRVQQSNEKWCQTDDLMFNEQIVPLAETNCESGSFETESDEFFFPGDSELANIAIEREEEDGKSDCNCNSIYVAHNTYGRNKCLCSVEDTWLKYDLRQGWNEICCAESKGYRDGLPTKEEYFRFKEELTREGEELLSDLSCLQLLYSDSKWVDEESVSGSNGGGAAKGDYYSTEFSNKLGSGKPPEDWRNIWNSDISRYSHEAIDDKRMKVKGKNVSRKLSEMRERPFMDQRWENKGKRRNSKGHRKCIQEDSQCHKYLLGEPAVPLVFPRDAPQSNEDSCGIPQGLKRPISF